ncbi:hypothetical protein Gohar_002500 [Gossypium harknessii]|uniref:MADS-box domain-containing protein n=3 Tax=Gossypium TaxID=3633 RepID=A0A7J9HKY2_9ROSI|nr:hypothetical protein [Gossypium harknessii]
MGRKKIKIQRLEDIKARQTKYYKRKTGILKKAKELSILCDVEVVLLLSSPAAKISFFFLPLGGRIQWRYVSIPDLDLGIFYFIISFFSQLKLVFLVKMLKKFYVNSDPEFDPLSMPHNRNANTLKVNGFLKLKT